MTCDYCDEDKPDTVLREDPFDRVVNDREWIRPLCDECHQLRFDES
ncbi:hypothetical protein ACGF0D_42710 [Kitasatospora sp. NPDC048298]